MSEKIKTLIKNNYRIASCNSEKYIYIIDYRNKGGEETKKFVSN
jgi:hypothetical protein